MKTFSARASRPRRAGFTLTELQVSVVLALIGLGATMGLAMNLVRSTYYVRMVGHALDAGRQQLEMLDEADYPALAAGTKRKGPFTLSWTVTEQERCKQVRMKIDWKDNFSRPHTLSMRGLYADPESEGYSGFAFPL